MIAFFEINEQEQLKFKDVFSEEVKFFKETINQVKLEEFKKAEIISVFVHSNVTKELITSLPNLKLITTRSMGIDHIDSSASFERGINVLSVPNYGESTVAEHTFALILALSRKITKTSRQIDNDYYDNSELRGFDLKGKTIGVLGGGKIGLHVVRMAEAFGMKVLVCDHNQNSIISEVLNFKYVTFNELIKASDIITLHLPLTDKTKHIINEESLSKMKRGVLLINTARGGLIDTKALAKALKEKTIGGVGLDVIEGEPLLFEDSYLIKPTTEELNLFYQAEEMFGNENVVFTPHNAFNSNEAVDKIIEVTKKNINDYLKKRIKMNNE